MNNWRMEQGFADRVFDIVNCFFLTLLGLSFIMPFVIVLIASFTPETEIIRSGYSLIPRGFTMESYKFVFSKNNRIFDAMMLSIAVTVIGMALSMLITSMYAYALSKPKYPFKKFIMLYLLFTMLFSGGLIPTFLIMRELNLINTFYILVLMNLLNPWNMIILRNNFMSIPDSISEAAIIDGCGQFKMFFLMVLPLSKAAMATIALFTAVAYWNDWITPMFYITSTDAMQPLQLLLQRMMARIDTVLLKQGSFQGTKVLPVESVKSVTVVIATLPIAIVYPFLQKYFVKGTLVGAVKE